MLSLPDRLLFCFSPLPSVIYHRFLQHRIRELWRSSTVGPRVLTRLFQFFASVYVGIGLLTSGLVLPLLLSDLFPEREPVDLIHEYVLYGAVVLLAIRLVLQKMPGGSIRPYLTLPVTRSSLVRFAHLDAAVSWFTLLPLVFLVPLWIRLWVVDGALAQPLVWIASLLLVVAATHFLHLALRLQVQDLTRNGKIAIGAGVALLIADAWAGAGLIQRASGLWFDAVAGGHLVAVAGCAAGAGISGVLATRELRRRIQTIAADASSTGSAVAGTLTPSIRHLLKRLPAGVVPKPAIPLILVETQMFARSKRARQAVLVGFGFGVYCVGYLWAFLGDVEAVTSFILLMFAIFAIMMPAVNYGQYGIAWSGTYFDRVLSVPAEQHLVLAKLRCTQGLCLVGFLLFGPPMAILLPSGLGLAVTGFLFSTGLLVPLSLLTSTLGRDAIQLNESQFANFQGTNVRHFLAGAALILLIAPFAFLSLTNALIAMGVIGLLGILFDRLWLRGLTWAYGTQRMPMAAGFRATES
jgi:hypothetical protein